MSALLVSKYIRERDHWGKTQLMLERNEELNRWHWVYTGTCFHLEQRCQKGKHKDKLRAVAPAPFHNSSFDLNEPPSYPTFAELSRSAHGLD